MIDEKPSSHQPEYVLPVSSADAPRSPGVQGDEARADHAVAPPGDEVERAKFDLHRSGPPPKLESAPLPWGYGVDRITALVRSPDNLFLYWEITDDGIAAARSRLGPAGANGWFNLRVYDTTGQHFDGTNAHSYVDLYVERAQREHFIGVQRPGSSVHVEIGVMTQEGYFQPIARSGRADFPRKSPSPNTSLEWMTVTSADENPAAAPYHSRYDGPSGPPAEVPPSSQASPELPEPHVSRTTVHAGPSTSWTISKSITSEWVTLSPHDIEHLIELPAFFQAWRTQWRSDLRHLRWAGQWPGAPIDGAAFEWRAGPFPLEVTGVTDPTRVEALLGGVPMLVSSEWGPVQIVGPWQVKIAGLESRPERRVIATWTMHWIKVAPPIFERWITGVERILYGAREHFAEVLGASEVAAARSLGASEAWRIGASERMWLGASEWMAFGASEWMAVGASGLAMLGASAVAGRGASESVLWGASEWLAQGGSEWLARGASELVAMGASESVALGASESVALGGSEHLSLGASESVALGGSERLSIGASEWRH
jgi:hypothetical protein